MRHWFEVRALDKCGNVQHSDYASWGPGLERDFKASLVAVIESVREQNPGCEIVFDGSEQSES